MGFFTPSIRHVVVLDESGRKLGVSRVTHKLGKVYVVEYEGSSYRLLADDLVDCNLDRRTNRGIQVDRLEFYE